MWRHYKNLVEHFGVLEWELHSIEHTGNDYFISGLKGVEMEGLKTRSRK